MTRPRNAGKLESRVLIFQMEKCWRFLKPKEMHEARVIHDAEEDDPGVVRRVLDEALKAGEAPTRAKITKAAKAKNTRRGWSG